MIRDELRAKFKAIAEFIYEDDKTAVDCSMEDAEAEGELLIIFDDYTQFNARFAEVEEACWVQGLTIAQEGKYFIVREDKGIASG